MSTIMNNLKAKIKKLRTTGFFSIFISNVFAKVLAFFGNIVVVNILTKNDYGIYAYALNAMNMLYIFNDFGASTAALQSLTEANSDKEKQRIILKYALKMGIIGSTFSGLLILLSPVFYPFEISEAKLYTPILCLIPFFTNINSFVLVLLRANLKNKKFAILNFTSTALNYTSLVIFSILFGLKGAIISQYCYLALQCILGFFLSKNILGNFTKAPIMEKKEKKSFIKYAFATQLNSTLASILLNVDIFLIGLIIANSEVVASYKVATTIPMALAFLPKCVMIYILPYFVMHNKDKKWLKTNYFKLIKYGSVAYLFITLIGIMFSNVIFGVLYKGQYNDSIPAYIILMIGFFFSATLRIPTHNILYSMRKLKINLIVTISSAILNFILNIVLINKIGMNGAAISTMIIQIFSSTILLCYALKVLNETNKMRIDKNSNR